MLQSIIMHRKASIPFDSHRFIVPSKLLTYLDFLLFCNPLSEYEWSAGCRMHQRDPRRVLDCQFSYLCTRRTDFVSSYRESLHTRSTPLRAPLGRFRYTKNVL